MVSFGGAGGDNVSCTGRRALQELQVKTPRPCLGKLEGLGGWILQRREAQGITQII